MCGSKRWHFFYSIIWTIGLERGCQKKKKIKLLGSNSNNFRIFPNEEISSHKICPRGFILIQCPSKLAEWFYPSDKQDQFFLESSEKCLKRLENNFQLEVKKEILLVGLPPFIPFRRYYSIYTVTKWFRVCIIQCLILYSCIDAYVSISNAIQLNSPNLHEILSLFEWRAVEFSFLKTPLSPLIQCMSSCFMGMHCPNEVNCRIFCKRSKLHDLFARFCLKFKIFWINNYQHANPH